MTSGTPPHLSPARRSRAAVVVTALCWLTVVFEGYDLIVYGSVLPVLPHEPGWHLNSRQLGAIGALTFVGMLLGAIAIGMLTDRLGRRRPLIACVMWFSLWMISCAVATTPAWFGASRFLAGLGFGGLIPTASALLTEYAPARHRTLVYSLALSGLPLGGVVAALLALPLLPEPGWRALFWIGACPLVLLVPLALRYLPESAQFLLARGETARAKQVAARMGIDLPDRPPATVSAVVATSREAGEVDDSLFRGRNLAASLCFWGATGMALLVWYSLGVWLPGLMRNGGYGMHSALTALLVLSIGGVVGSWVTAFAGDRVGHKPVAVASFLLVAASLASLATSVPKAVVYILLALAGTGAVSSQVLINTFVAAYFPVSRRASALGWALGIGRAGAIAGPPITGAVLDAGMSFRTDFYLFAGCAIVGATLIAAVPSRRAGVAVRVPAVQPLSSNP